MSNYAGLPPFQTGQSAAGAIFHGPPLKTGGGPRFLGPPTQIPPPVKPGNPPGYLGPPIPGLPMPKSGLQGHPLHQLLKVLAAHGFSQHQIQGIPGLSAPQQPQFPSLPPLPPVSGWNPPVLGGFNGPAGY